ncbi:MAG TPA: hypothetical protein VKZ50_09015 [bacterium]|nr:hypothetical protein [bacterium]
MFMMFGWLVAILGSALALIVILWLRGHVAMPAGLTILTDALVVVLVGAAPALVAYWLLHRLVRSGK